MTSTYKKPWSLVAAACLMTASLPLAGCGPGLLLENETSWVHKNLAHLVQFNAGASGNAVTGKTTLWRGDGIVLEASNSSVLELRSKLVDGSLVMVSFVAGSEVGRYLADAPSTWAFHSTPEGGYGLVYVKDTFTLDGLAALAHRDIGCGAIELLSLTDNLDGATDLLPPVYNEFVALAPVSAAASSVSSDRILSSIKQLEALGTRHHDTDTGLQTPDLVQTMFTQAANGIAGFAVSQLSHADAGATVQTAQKSVIASLPGKSDDNTTVIIGAHLDSINRFGKTQNAPGADDNASGIATLTEVLRVIAAKGWTFQRRVEFHAYAAEEVGLIGSKHTAQTYRASNRKVAAMLQVDMNSWSADPASQTIHLVDQFTSPTLIRALKDLLHTYFGGNFAVKSLSGGTSDHKSWHTNGFPAVFPFEDPQNYNQALHTVDDNSANINNTAMSSRFAQMILAFLAHNAGLTQASGFADAYQTERAKLPKDLYLAFAQGGGEGFYNISVSAPLAVTTVEICFANSAGSASCVKEKSFTTDADMRGNRRLFSVDHETALTAGDRIAVFGYDTADKLVALRTARLDQASN